MIQTNGLSKAVKVFTIISGSIVIVGFLWYFIVDGFTIVNKVNEHDKNITLIFDTLNKHLDESKGDNSSVRNIEYNLKRMLEKNGMEWKTLETK